MFYNNPNFCSQPRLFVMKKIKKYLKENFSNFTYFYSLLRFRLLVVIGLSILVGLLDSIGLTMFLPLLQLADGSDKNADLGNLNFITNALAFLGIQLTITKALFFLVFVFILKGFVVYKTNIYKLNTQQQLTRKVRMDVVDLFPLFSYKQFIKTDLGKIQNIFIGEVVRLYNNYVNYISALQGIILIIVYISFSFLVDWQFALLVCIGGLFSNLIFKKINQETKKRSKNISKVNNTFANVLIQFLNNYKYLKATGNILLFRDKIEKSINDVQFESLKIGKLNAIVSSFREPILVIIIVIIIAIEITFFNASISSMMISLLFFYRALSSVVSVQNNFNQAISNQGAIDNILSFKQEIQQHKEVNNKEEFGLFQNKIQFNNVSFTFDDGVKILKDIDFSISKNQSIAFVGESGSGKTTLINLIVNLLQPSNGNISIDGVNLQEYNRFSFQKIIGYISQEPSIFNDTIFNNVTFWAEKTPQNIAKFNEALKKASIFDFIYNLTDKENTLLGNSGVNLSGGQRQRISIARELFKEVQILILDEATSALDSETEREIQNSIDQLKGQVTIISIAHRLSTIKNADIIYLMDKGEIISQGNFSELVIKSDRFKKLVDLQEI